MAILQSISLPQGVRDMLPEEAERINSVESALSGVFAAHGFKPVRTPLLEYIDVLMLGMGENLKDKILKFIDPATGRVVAIRPDITSQIARIVATRMRDCQLPLKLCYNESVLRYLDAREGRSREIIQIGAECVTAVAAPEVDAEMIIMAVEALKAIGLKGFKIDIGDVSFLKAILNGIGLAADEGKAIKDAIAIKDTTGLDRALSGFGKKISGADKKLLLNLTTLYGEEEVIDKALALAGSAATRAALANLSRIIDIVGKSGYRDCVTIDLGEMRGFDYYTGIIFEGFVTGIGQPILSGGRYDNLLEKYGYQAAATGFAFDVESVAAALGVCR